jgi:hypothetical protein
MSALHAFQTWLVTAIFTASPLGDLMGRAWMWPIAESIHFIGLSLLIGAIGTFDLRLLGLMRRVPIAVVHRFVPWAVLGFVLNAASGVCFVLTEPDQYLYNPSFHWKLAFMAIAGVNAGLFYLTSYGRVLADATLVDAPRRAKVIAIVSLSAWIGVITCGRLLTFYRPVSCLDQPEAVGVLLSCDPR